MKWQPLTGMEQLAEIDAISATRKVMIFKHSTRCGYSKMALDRVERGWKAGETLLPYYLDLLSFRPLSAAIASHYHIQHESPQVLIISNGQCIYSASHSDIVYANVIAAAGKD